MTQNHERSDGDGVRDAALIVAIFSNREDADRAVEELRDVAFPAKDIGIASRGESGLAPFDPEGNPGIDVDAAYDPATYPPGPETTRSGGSPFTQTDEELAWEEDHAAEPMGVTALEGSGTARPGSGPDAGESRDPVAVLRAAGIPADRARSLAHKLPLGGALVTIRSVRDSSEAEAILQRNKGRVHFEIPLDSAGAGAP